jgi:hypothetical protein
VESLGGSENATKHMPNDALGRFWIREDQPESHHKAAFLACSRLVWGKNPGVAPRRFGSFVARAGFHWRFTPVAHLAAAEIATTGSGRRNDEILG